MILSIAQLIRKMNHSLRSSSNAHPFRETTVALPQWWKLTNGGSSSHSAHGANLWVAVTYQKNLQIHNIRSGQTGLQKISTHVYFGKEIVRVVILHVQLQVQVVLQRSLHQMRVGYCSRCVRRSIFTVCPTAEESDGEFVHDVILQQIVHSKRCRQHHLLVTAANTLPLDFNSCFTSCKDAHRLPEVVARLQPVAKFVALLLAYSTSNKIKLCLHEIQIGAAFTAQRSADVVRKQRKHLTALRCIADDRVRELESRIAERPSVMLAGLKRYYVA